MPENRRRFRNPVATSPLLRKGGPHQVSRSGERRNQRQALEAELDSWWEESDELNPQTEEPAPDGADSSVPKGFTRTDNSEIKTKTRPNGPVKAHLPH